MKTKRNLFIVSLCVLFMVCYYIMNQTYDELARYPYATEENHDLILGHLNDKDIDILLAQNIKPEQFLPYVDYEGFNLKNTLWYDKAMKIQPADASYIVQFIETWKDKFTFNDMSYLLDAYRYDTLVDFFTNGDPFVKKADLIINPNDLMTDLKENRTIYHYEPSDLVALDMLPHVNINSDNKKVYLREQVIEPLKDMCTTMTLVSGKENYDMIIVGGYVSYEDQKTLYQNALLQYGAKEFKKYEAYPGHSEKQLGFVVQFSIAGNQDLQQIQESEQVKWLNEHAHEYGFIIRYPLGKEGITKKVAQPLTLRYVGKAKAKEMKEHNWTWEEMCEYYEK